MSLKEWSVEVLIETVLEAAVSARNEIRNWDVFTTAGYEQQWGTEGHRKPGNN